MRTPRDETRLKSLEADLAEAEQQLRGVRIALDWIRDTLFFNDWTRSRSS
jgi:hypothetical protein